MSQSDVDESLRYLNEDELAELDQLLTTGQIDTELPPDWFHEGQLEAWGKENDVVLLLCGTQSGKTVFGPHWLLREIQRKGPGEYGVVGPTFSLLYKKVIPEVARVYASLGKPTGSPVPKFEFSKEGLMKLFGRDDQPVTIYFGYAENSDSLESMTLKAVWSDECGQAAFKQTSYEALNRRLAVENGRHLMTTTPYEFGWLKSDVYDRWTGGAKYIGVVNFASTMNPTFSVERYERAKAEMPPWRFQMMYEGRFTRPAGAIYDCFDENNIVDTIEFFYGDVKPPEAWPRFLGIDFGNINTAAVMIAQELKRTGKDKWGEPTGKYVVYQTYYPQKNLKAREHAIAIAEKLDWVKPVAFGGSHQEEGWREAFQLSGLWVREPEQNDVEVQINKTYAGFASKDLLICSHLTSLIDDINAYSLELDENGEPIPGKIRDKAKWHRLDALRYIGSYIFKEKVKTGTSKAYRAA